MRERERGWSGGGGREHTPFSFSVCYNSQSLSLSPHLLLPSMIFSLFSSHNGASATITVTLCLLLPLMTRARNDRNALGSVLCPKEIFLHLHKGQGLIDRKLPKGNKTKNSEML
jgi:hypothetical protein